MRTILSLITTLPLAVACTGSGGPLGPRGELTIATAPLTLEGVGDACYGLRVKNGGGETVWQQTNICADQYGDERSAIAYVGSCDASAGNEAHTVELVLEGLWDEAGVLLTDYVNPAPSTRPIIRPATCVPNADTQVVFNLVIARQANQGFVDLMVNFEDVFCSAKLDCQQPNGTNNPLVPDPAGGPGRLDSAVLALACTGGPSAATHVYWSDITITCGASTTTIPLDGPAGLMWSASNPAPAPLAQGMIFRGLESLTDSETGAPLSKAYFNVALGIDFPVSGPCTITATGTVSDGALDQCTTPDEAVYPVIRVSAPFINQGGTDFACFQHPLDGTPGSGVWTDYTIDGPETFATEAFGQAGDLVAQSCRPPALVLTALDPTLGETGADTATVTARLSRAPLAPVTFPFTASPQRIIGLGSLTFTPSNWATGYTLTLMGDDDGVAGPSVPITFSGGPGSSTDARFVGLTGSVALTLLQDGPYCGDGVRQGAEACDGVDVPSSCAALGFDSGDLGCTAGCAFDTSACIQCGDGVVEGPEDCDTQSSDCTALGFGDFDSGTATCNASCTWDTSACTSCGDGVRQGDEDCDGADLGGHDCTTIGAGHVGGDLACDPSCTFDENACVSAICGNSDVEPSEECDPPTTPTCGYGATCAACDAFCQDFTVQGPFCGDGIQNGPEACDGNDKPTCAELSPATPYGTVTCTAGCAITSSCSADPCAGQPTTHTGNVTLNGDAAPAGVTNPECITTINGTVTVNGSFGASPTIRFPRLRAIVSAGFGLVINAWPDGVALFPALEASALIQINGPGANNKVIELPVLFDGSLSAGVQQALIFVGSASGVTLNGPALVHPSISTGSGSSDSTFNLGGTMSSAQFLLLGSATVNLPASVTSLHQVKVSAAVTFNATGVTNINTFGCSDWDGLTGLNNVQTIGGVDFLVCPANMPNLTTASSTGMIAYAPSMFSAPALATINAPSLQIDLYGNSTVGVLTSFAGTISLVEHTTGTLTFSALTSIGSLSFVGPNTTNPTYTSGSPLAGLSMPNLATVTGNFTVTGYPSLPQSDVDAILAHTTVGGVTSYCGNQGGTPCTP